MMQYVRCRLRGAGLQNAGSWMQIETLQSYKQCISSYYFNDRHNRNMHRALTCVKKKRQTGKRGGSLSYW